MRWAKNQPELGLACCGKAGYGQILLNSLRPETLFENRVRHPGEGQDPVRVGRNSKGGSANKRLLPSWFLFCRHPGRWLVADPDRGSALAGLDYAAGDSCFRSPHPVRCVRFALLFAPVLWPDVPMGPLPQLSLSPASPGQARRIPDKRAE